MRKAKLKNLGKFKTKKAVRAHLRRCKEQQSKKAEAPPAGDETPLAAEEAFFQVPSPCLRHLRQRFGRRLG